MELEIQFALTLVVEGLHIVISRDIADKTGYFSIESNFWRDATTDIVADSINNLSIAEADTFSFNWSGVKVDPIAL